VSNATPQCTSVDAAPPTEVVGRGVGAEVHPLKHDFLHEAWDGINETERQRQFRRIAPMPFGAVLIARDDMDEDTVRWHLRTMRELGFNAIKQFMPCPRWPNATLEELALEAGLTPWWYGEGGWEPITEQLCVRLGIDPATPICEIRRDERMLRHQRAVLARRVGRPKLQLNPEQQTGVSDARKGSVAADYGADAKLPDWAEDTFRDWLRERYDNDIDRLNRGWNMDVHRVSGPDDDKRSGFVCFEEITLGHMTRRRDYGRIRDILRFKADLKNRDVLAVCAQARERDPHEPHRSGGEMGLFLPFASRGTDMEGIARAMRDTGSFYPSIHLCWHFEETHFEVARPVYMQASFVVDLNKGGWTAPWESTGGPQQTSGSNAWLYEWVRDRQPGFTVDAGVMTQLLLSYLAAGCRGVGLWAWNARRAGVEAGEYALLDRNEQVCDRTRRVGAIAEAANRLRDELWACHKEPQVGILMDWDNEATWAAMSEFNRTVFKHYPVEARIGACRALIDANIPFEYVTAQNLREGLAPRYPIIYMPGFLGLNPDLLPILSEYVLLGGRLVVDMPGGGYDHTGRVLSTRCGTDFERLFGVELSDLQYSGNNVAWHIGGEAVRGYTADLTPTSATVLHAYDNGRPAVTENVVGKGRTVVLGWESGRACYRPGNLSWQRRLVSELLGGASPFIVAEGKPWVYRLAGPHADHYFLINDGARADVQFRHVPFAYSAAADVLSGESLDLASPIAVERTGGRWLRCVKA